MRKIIGIPQGTAVYRECVNSDAHRNPGHVMVFYCKFECGINAKLDGDTPCYCPVCARIEDVETKCETRFGVRQL